MAFSGSSYFAGIGTVFAAVAFGVACGSMVTTSVVQPPNRLERVNAGATDHSNRSSKPSSAASSGAEQASTAKPVPQEIPPRPVATAAPSVPAVDPQPAPLQQPAASAAVKVDAATRVQEQPAAAATKAAPVPVAKSDEASVTRNEGTVGRASDRDREASRSADPNRQASRKRKSSDDRKFSERRRRHDQDERQPDEAANVIRQMPRERAVDDVVEQDDGPRFGMRPRHVEILGDEDPPRRVDGPPPGIGFFGLGD